MNGDIKTLTDRLIAKADKELEKRIEKAAKPFDSECRDGCAWQVTFRTNEVSWYEALSTIGKTLFERRRDKNRQDALDSFMERVNGIQHDIDELRNEL